MNDLAYIKDRFKYSNLILSEALNVNVGTVRTLLNRELDHFSLRQLIALKNLTGLSFNELLGENLINEADNIQPKRTTLSQKQAKDLLIKLLDQIEVPSDEHKDLIVK